MKIEQVLDNNPFANAGINSIHNATTNGEPEITLRHFDDSNISPEMAELFRLLKLAQTEAEIRMILAMYLPALNDGAEVK